MYKRQKYGYGVVTLNDGKLIECEIRFPIRNGRSDGQYKFRPHKRLTIKNSNGKQETIDFGLISNIKAKSGSYAIYLVNTKVKTIKKNKSVVTDDGWLVVNGGCEELIYYTSVKEINIATNDQFVLGYSNGYNGQLLKRSYEQYPTLIGYDDALNRKKSGYDKKRKKLLAKYFKDDKAALKLLEKEKISLEELELLLSEMCKIL